MNIRLITVGRVKEKFFTEAVAEYSKRLSRYCTLTVAEVPDEPTPENAADSVKAEIMRREGIRILKHVRDSDYVIALAIEGKQRTSEELAEHLNDLAIGGRSTIDFIIGGSLGLAPEVMSRSDEALSFSKMTFPHPLMRVILLEQIYRGFMILNNRTYHK